MYTIHRKSRYFFFDQPKIQILIKPSDYFLNILHLINIIKYFDFKGTVCINSHHANGSRNCVSYCSSEKIHVLNYPTKRYIESTYKHNHIIMHVNYGTSYMSAYSILENLRVSSGVG